MVVCVCRTTHWSKAEVFAMTEFELTEWFEKCEEVNEKFPLKSAML